MHVDRTCSIGWGAQDSRGGSCVGAASDEEAALAKKEASCARPREGKPLAQMAKMEASRARYDVACSTCLKGQDVKGSAFSGFEKRDVFVEDVLVQLPTTHKPQKETMDGYLA